MPTIKRLMLDVLKPHQPNALDFASAIAELGRDYRVRIAVREVDEKTETLALEIEAESIEFDAVVSRITDLGASLHSIDEVEVHGYRDEME